MPLLPDRNSIFDSNRNTVYSILCQDSYGQLQKLVTFQLSTGVVADLYVRKMAYDDSLGQVSSKKRTLGVEGDSVVSKKLITEQNFEENKVVDSNKCCDHLKEIESLKQQLKENSDKQCCDHLKEIETLKKDLGNRDFEVAMLNEMVSKFQKDKKFKKK